GLEALLQSPHLGALRNLRIGSRITDPGVRVLAAAPAASRLRRLDLSWNHQLGVAGAGALGASGHPTKPEGLDPPGTKIGDGGALALIHSTRLPNLRMLRVGTERRPRSDAVSEAMARRFGHRF